MNFKADFRQPRVRSADVRLAVAPACSRLACASRRRRPCLLIVVALAVLGFSASAPAADRVLAKGKGIEVTQNELDEAYVALRASLAAQGRTVPESQRRQVEQQLLQRLVMTEVLLARATDEDRTRGRERALKIVEQERAKAKSPEAFDNLIRANGLSPEAFERQLIERSVVELVIERDLRPKVQVTETQVRDFYEKNSPEFEQPERVHAAHILIGTRNLLTNAPLPEEAQAAKRELAETIARRVRAGEDFAALAKEFSDDPGSRDRGGEYTFPRGQMVPEFERTAFAQAAGQVSDPVKTDFGWHIIKTIEKLPARRVPLEEVEPRIRTQLEIVELQSLIPDYQKQVVAEAGVEFTGAD